MVKGLTVVEKALHKKKLLQPIRSRVFEVVGPYEMQERWEEIAELPDKCLLLRTRLTGICRADLRYVNCSRPPRILSERLPMCVFHEGTAQVVAVGNSVEGFSEGDRVVVAPNIPCYVHNPEKYPEIRIACASCRPGGAGENLCEDARFLSSNAHGLSRTFFIHPAVCTFVAPSDVPEEIAVLTEPLTVISRAIKKAAISPHDRVAVLGGGFMGFIAAAVLSKVVGVPKGNLLVTDIFDHKLEKLKDLADVLNSRDEPLGENLLSSYDKAFECVGGKAAETTIDQALSLLSPGGACLLIGVSEGSIPIKTRPLLEKGLSLEGTTRSAGIDYPEVLEWLRQEELRKTLERIIFPRTFTAESRESLISACRTAEDPETHGKVLIDWRQKGEK